MTAVIFRLLSEDTLALCIQLQLAELLSMERIHCRPHWQDRVEVVALPLHSALVEIAAGLHNDESHLQECADVFYRGVLGDIS